MPEEISRVITDHITSIFFCPTETAVDNLRKEGVTNIFDPSNSNNPTNSINLYPVKRDSYYLTGANNPIVLNVGDVMYDAFLFNKKLSDSKSNILSELDLEASSYCLAKVHKQENTEDPQRLLNIFKAFEELSNSGYAFIILLHPRTRKALQRYKNRKTDLVPMSDCSPQQVIWI